MGFHSKSAVNNKMKLTWIFVFVVSLCNLVWTAPAKGPNGQGGFPAGVPNVQGGFLGGVPGPNGRVLGGSPVQNVQPAPMRVLPVGDTSNQLHRLTNDQLEYNRLLSFMILHHSQAPMVKPVKGTIRRLVQTEEPPFERPFGMMGR